MKSYKILSICFGAMVSLATLNSCKKDLSPSDIIDDTKAYRNLSDINLGLIGAYAALGTSHVTNTSLESDEVMLPTENTTGGQVSTYRWQIDGSNSTITAGWAEYYTFIDRVNRVLKAIDNVPVAADETALRDRYKGELLALRAFAHFSLLQQFASSYTPDGMGVPYMKTSTISKPSRPKVSENMADIKADLAAAKPLMPDNFTDKSRITKKAIPAIQARVALWEKNWTDAITYSTEAIAANPLDSRSDVANVWNDASENGVIWKLKRVTGDALIGSFYTSTGNMVLYAPSYELVSTFDTSNDIRYKTWIRWDRTRGTGKSEYIVRKYYKSGTNLADIKLFRTAEQYLIRAEAYAQSNQLIQAAADLNTLRAARITGYTAQTFASQQALMDAIIIERFKELAFEGHRYFDLRRYGLDITRSPADAINAQGAILLTPAQAQYVWAIPDAEIKANGNIVQNPYY